MKGDKMNNLYFCTRPRLYSFLVEKGFKVIRTMPNYYNPEYVVWVFEQTPEMEKAKEEFFLINKK